MTEWIKNNDRKRKFALILGLMIIISLCCSFYINFRSNRMTIGDHVYVVDEIKEDSWYFVSETGDNIVVSNGEGREIFWHVDDITMSIGKDDYDIYKEIDQGLNSNYFIDLNGEKVDVSRTSSLIRTKQEPILIKLIVFYVFITTLACINMVFPEFSWKIRMIFITRGGEPTEFYLGIVRVISFLAWVITMIRMATIS